MIDKPSSSVDSGSARLLSAPLRVLSLFLSLAMVFAFVPITPLPQARASAIVDWAEYGTCEWMVDDAGCLVIRPLDNAANGALGDWGAGYAPWYSYRTQIFSAKIEGSVSITNQWGLFYGLKNMVSIDLSGLDTSNATSLESMFQSCSSLVNLDLSSFITTNVTSMQSMFSGCSHLQTINLATVDTSHVSDMTAMFASCRSLNHLDLSRFNTSSVTDMSSMFSGARASSVKLGGSLSFCGAGSTRLCNFIEYDLAVGFPGKWIDNATGEVYEPSSVPNNKSATYVPEEWIEYGSCEWKIDNTGCLTVRPVGGSGTGVLPDWRPDGPPWRASSESIKSVVVENGVSAETMETMFYECTNLASVDLSGLDSSQVTDMMGVFLGCSALKNVNLAGLDTSNVTNMGIMFNGCSSLESLDLSMFDTAKVTAMEVMFYGCTSLKYLDLSSFNTSSLERGMQDSFRGCSSLTTVKLGRDFAFYHDASYPDVYLLPVPSIEKGYTGNWVNQNGEVFTIREIPDNVAATYTAQLAEEGWSRSGTCEWMINASGCLTIRPAGNASSGTLEDWGDGAAPWHESCGQITAAVVTGNVTVPTAARMFSGCSNMANASLSGLDTSQTTTMREMFRGCSSLNSLDLSSFNTMKVTDMLALFMGCSSLKSLDISSFNTYTVTDMSLMFEGCSALEAITVCELFAFKKKADGTRQCQFPTPSDGNRLTGNWVGPDNTIYRPDEIPDHNPGTYTAQVAEQGWTSCGTCEWRLKGGSLLQIRPVGGASSGVLDDWGTNPAPWASEAGSITRVEVTGTVKATTCRGMFQGITKIGSFADFNLDGLDTSEVADMSYMFAGCSHLENFDTRMYLSKFDTSNVTDFTDMFAGCTSLRALIIPIFNTMKAERMEGMLESCAALAHVELGPLFSFYGSAGNRLCNLPVPTVDGEAGRWYSSVEKDSFDPEDIVGCEAAMYDAVTIAKYTVSFDLLDFDKEHGAAPVADQIVLDRGKVTAPATPKAPGWNFTGWYKENGDPWSFSEDVVRADTTIYAHWEPRSDTSYKVEHYCQSASDNSYALTDTDELTGTTLNTAVFTPKSYYGFVFDESKSDRLEIKGDGSTVVKVFYNRIASTVSFDANGHGSNPAPVSVRFGALVPEPESPTADGYAFGGWYEDSACTTAWDFERDTLSLDMTLYAKWAKESYTISYELDGGTNSEANPQSYDVESETIVLQEPTRDGFTFAGWFEGDTQVTEIAKGSTGDRTLTAKWAGAATASYTVKHYLQDVKGDGYALGDTEVLSGPIGKSVSAEPMARTGFSLREDAPGAVPSGTVLEDGSLVLALYYDRNVHKVTFDTRGHGIEPAAQYVRYGAYIDDPGKLTEDGWLFKKWRTEYGLIPDWFFFYDTMPDEDIEFYASWYEVGTWRSAGSCEWTIDDAGCLTVRPRNGASSGAFVDWAISPAPWFELTDYIITARFEGTISAPSTSFLFDSCKNLISVDLLGLDTSGTDEMYLMFGYCRSLTSLDLSTIDTTKATNMSYMFDGCDSLDAITLGEKFSFSGAGEKRLCSLPDRKTSKYSGKWVNVETGEVFAADEIPNNTAATYVRQRNVNTVTFDLNGHGEVAPTPQSVRLGALAERPADPSEDGWFFADWYKDSACTTVWDFEKDAPTLDTTLYAKWEEVTPGDVTGDEVLDIRDLVLLQRHLAGKAALTGLQLITADYNKDDTVNMKDLLAISKELLNA